MTSLIDAVRDNREIPDIAVGKGRIAKRGCRLNKKNVPSKHVQVNLDLVQALCGSKHADFLFLMDRDGGYVVPIEVKKGAPKLSDVVEQLRASGRAAEGWLSDCEVAVFRPVLVSGRLPKQAYHELRKKRNHVSFQNGKAQRIVHVQCGGGLRNVLD